MTFKHYPIVYKSHLVYNADVDKKHTLLNEKGDLL